MNFFDLLTMSKTKPNIEDESWVPVCYKKFIRSLLADCFIQYREQTEIDILEVLSSVKKMSDQITERYVSMPHKEEKDTIENKDIHVILRDLSSIVKVNSKYRYLMFGEGSLTINDLRILFSIRNRVIGKKIRGLCAAFVRRNLPQFLSRLCDFSLMMKKSQV